MFLSALFGPVITAVAGAFGSWFKHKTAATEATRDINIEQIRAGVAVQGGSWKDEYFTIFWTAPLYPPLFGSVWYWNPQIFIDFVNALPGWYTTILIGMTTASFGVKTFKDWKAGVLDREMKWDRHEKNGKPKGLDMADVPPTPEVPRWEPPKGLFPDPNMGG